MLKEQFLGRNPSHFQTNPVVKAFIISEVLVWSAWNFFAPIYAIFAVTKVPGGTVEIAASSYSAHLVGRIISELITGRYLIKKNDQQKFIVSIVGIALISIAFVGFAFTQQIIYLFVFHALSGIGIGIASPAKNSLFSTHLDKNKESSEWGIYDAVTFTGTASAAALGGFIASSFGFQFLFLLASFVNILGIIPYFLYINQKHTT